jgi:hypothetical protein
MTGYNLAEGRKKSHPPRIVSKPVKKKKKNEIGWHRGNDRKKDVL